MNHGNVFSYDCDRKRLANLLRMERRVSGQWPKVIKCRFDDRKVAYYFLDPFGNHVTLHNVEDYPNID